MDIIIEELDKTHDRVQFHCGNDPLNAFLKRFARQNQENNISKTFVAVFDECMNLPLKPLLGFYTLSSGQISNRDLPEKCKHPNYPVSVARIARLAVDKQFQGKSIGGYLLYDALKKIQLASQVVGIYSVIVDAKNEKASQFYQHFGFQILQESTRTLFLPMSTVNQLFSV